MITNHASFYKKNTKIHMLTTSPCNLQNLRIDLKIFYQIVLFITMKSNEIKQTCVMKSINL